MDALGRGVLTPRGAASVPFSTISKPGGASLLYDGRVSALGILGAQLRRRAKDRGLSLYELADFAGIARSHIYQIVNGHRAPTLTTLDKLAAALECEPWELLAPLKR